MPSLFSKALNLALQVKDPNSAAVFALVIACVGFWVALKNRDKRTVLILGLVFGIGIIVLGVLPLLAKTYMSTHGIYEIRIVVLGPDQIPVDHAEVICSLGGEEKIIGAGGECDVPPRNRPADGMFTAYASEKSAFLTGQGQLHLEDDYNPVLTIHLQADSSATVGGEVKGTSGNVLRGAWVSVVGHGSERVQTGSGGEFVLHAHAAIGEMIKLHVEAQGYQTYEGLQQAGDTSISIQLER